MPTFPRSPHFDRNDEVVLPVVQEELQVDKRIVDTGVVHVRTVTRTHEEVVDIPLEREEVQIERVAIGRPVDRPVEARQEGDVMIVPVHEEVIVVQRQLMLKEELHIRRRVATVQSTQPVTLRRQDVEIDHHPIGGATPLQ
ncbi:YsnF/AvaK domain-containing protein [Lysobacter sp. HA18]